ncbi:hypothetical protein [Cerasicoccus maritimus]|uniref:hypothetical protein n=1 Tax=Cerasicoccus maritimus TaxID=490089 RepID=UPI002852A296|nr:hypothetical protein [Cerasicoccus maritimus]
MPRFLQCLLFAWFTLGASGLSVAKTTSLDLPLVMDLVEGWSAESFAGLANYFDLRKDPGSAGLMIKVERNHPMAEADISLALDQFVRLTVQNAKDSGAPTPGDPEFIPIIGKFYQGQAVMVPVNLDLGFYSARIILTDGRQSLDCNFHGKGGEWSEAETMLLSIRRNAWNQLGPATVLAEKNDGDGRVAVMFSRIADDGRVTYHLSVVKEDSDPTWTNGNVLILDAPIMDFEWGKARQLQVKTPDGAQVFYRNGFPMQADAIVKFANRPMTKVLEAEEKTTPQAMTFQAEPPWQWEYVDEEDGRYLFGTLSDSKATMTVHPQIAGLTKSEGSAQLQLDMFAEAFPRGIERNLDTPMEVLEILPYDFEGDAFHGRMMLATIRAKKDGSVFCVGYFYLTDGVDIYMGQYNGPKEMAAAAREILGSAQPYQPE